MQPHSPVESGFMPRKEFIRDQRTKNDFCLLAISSASLVRLYSFPLTVIDSLRRLFDHFYLILAFREDPSQNLCEFALEGKPWASPKSVRTERILVDILSVIYKHGYSFVSTIDYGRENDDRLALAFSKPSGSPSPPHSMTPIPAGSGSNISHQTVPKVEKKAPFAISFVSATVLRVIYPPLNSTPAILQAVRAAWPRGVVSEKKAGDLSYEFKLKGYKWFHEDTFATDSLKHILSLLSSLDAHAFSLVASLSLSNRSRVKDLWIFTGAGSAEVSDQLWPESPIATMSHSGSFPELRPNLHPISDPPIYAPEKAMPPSYRRMVTTSSAPHHEQQPPFSQPHTSHLHARAAAKMIPPIITNPGPASPLRKPAPRAQVPISVELDAVEDEGEGQFNPSLPSVVPSSVENMTGIGTQARRRFSSNLIYSSTPPPQDDTHEQVMEGSDSRYPPFQSRSGSRSSFARRMSAFRPSSTRLKTPTAQSLASSSRDPGSSSSPSAAREPPAPMDNQEALLAGTFSADDIRDSTCSSQTYGTEAASEYPMKWTVGGRDVVKTIDEGHEEARASMDDSPSSPILPGGWKSTPKENGNTLQRRSRREDTPDVPQGVGEGMPSLSLERDRHPDRSLQDVDARVTSPAVVTDLEEATRRSEAGLIGIMSSPSTPVSPTRRNPLVDNNRTGGHSPVPRSPTKGASGCSTGTGWVLVNVEAKASQDEHHLSRNYSPSPRGASSPNMANGRGPKQPTIANHTSSMSPAAKAIAIIDAKESKSPKAKAKPSSGLRRFLSLSRSNKNAAQETEHTKTERTRSRSTELPLTADDGQKFGSKIRSKISRNGPVEASPRRVNGQRIALD